MLLRGGEEVNGMRKTKSTLLLGVTIVAALATLGAIVIVAAELFVQQRVWRDLFLAWAVLNAILFLIYYRHALRNEALSETQKHHWSIALFLGMSFGQLVYWLRYLRNEQPASSS